MPQYGTSKKANVDKGRYPILRMNNITYNGNWDFSNLKYIDLDERDISKYLVHYGEVLFNRTNSKELVGKTAVYLEKYKTAFTYEQFKYAAINSPLKNSFGVSFIR